MSEGDVKKPPGTAKLKIASSKDLFESLRSRKTGERLSVLSAIANNPVKAMSYGPYQRRDLIDELREQLADVKDLGYRRALVAVLAALPDLRVIEILKQCFSRFDDAPAVLICAERLAEGPEMEVKTFFQPFLDREDSPLQTRLAANVLAKFKNTSPETMLKLALWADEAPLPPDWDQLTKEQWINPLLGSSAFRLRQMAERIGLEAFMYYSHNFDLLPVEAQRWMIRWGSETFPGHATAMLRLALTKDELIPDAVETIGRTRQLTASFESAITPLLKATDPEIRLAALKAGAKPASPLYMLANETDMSVRCFLIVNLYRWIENPADTIITFLKNDDWRLRAAAAQALKAMESTPVEAVRRLLKHERLEVRTAALQILSDKDDTNLP